MADRLGVGAWLWVREGRSFESALFLPLLPEDMGKEEWVGGYRATLTQGMLGLIGGGVRAGETVEEALRREAREEQHLSLNGNLKGLEPKLTVGQIRKGAEVLFEVALFELVLSRSKVSDLSQRTNPVEVSWGQMPTWLADNRGKLRPFAQAFAQRMLNDLR